MNATEAIPVVLPIVVGLYLLYEYTYGTAAEVRQMRQQLKDLREHLATELPRLMARRFAETPVNDLDKSQG